MPTSSTNGPTAHGGRRGFSRNRRFTVQFVEDRELPPSQDFAYVRMSGQSVLFVKDGRCSSVMNTLLGRD